MAAPDSFLSFIHDRKAVRERGDWLVDLYLISPSGVPTTLRFSHRGTVIGTASITVTSEMDEGGEDVLPANTPYRKRLLQAPEYTQSLWQTGQILSDSVPSYGSIILNNRDGGLDQYRPINGWIWQGQKYKVYFGDSGTDALFAQTAAKITDGYLGTPSFTLTEVAVPTNGFEILFGGGGIVAGAGAGSSGAGTGNGAGAGASLSVPTSKRVFRGASYMLELSGAKTVTYGSPGGPLAVGLQSTLTLETWIWIDALGSDVTPTWGWMVAATGRPWWLSITDTGALIMAGFISGSVETITAFTHLSPQVMYHLAISIDGQSVTFVIWNDDDELSTVEEFPTAFSSPTRDAVSATAVYRLATSTATIWFDEMRVWNVARSLSEIESDRFRTFIGNAPSTLVHYASMNDGGGTTVTDSSATGSSGTIAGAGTHTWLHTQEGEPPLSGTPKPDVWGEKWGVAAVLVDPVRQGYMIAGGGSVESIVTYAGASPHTMDASAASYRAYLTTTPAAGHCLPYLPRGLFKLGSKPTLPVSAFVKGYNGGPLGYVNTGATITRDMITRRGPKLSDPAAIDTDSFDAYDDALPYIMGCSYQTPVELRAALDFSVMGGGGWWGYLRSSVKFHIEQFTGAGRGEPLYTFDEKRIVELAPLPAEAVVYEVVVKYRHNDVVLKENEVAEAVKGTADWQQWTLEWQTQKSTDEELRERYGKTGHGLSLVIETGLQYAVDAKSLADFLLNVLKGLKDGWSVTLDSTGLQLTPGMVVALSVRLQQQEDYRLSLDGTRNFVIMSVTDSPQQGVVQVDLWGGGEGQENNLALIGDGSGFGLIGDGSGSVLTE